MGMHRYLPTKHINTKRLPEHCELLGTTGYNLGSYKNVKRRTQAVCTMAPAGKMYASEACSKRVLSRFIHAQMFRALICSKRAVEFNHTHRYRSLLMMSHNVYEEVMGGRCTAAKKRRKTGTHQPSVRRAHTTVRTSRVQARAIHNRAPVTLG